ncbi:MAG: 2-oxoglutarate dehydrogenase complex dihydrolipoyllysine-residue succinyltransferase [Proteobacteria bacterium]|jgi:2-oxoglutarate dehydrogenase E2 component (dihydrolipoamide succinyltransferase)|uniref:Dihydrolipoyllysine-residue succinyltransferase component of 2-oxoglutarate dehydrogenase complex n=2 Tax=Candidatus Fonsibacter lacus TaxID=2576439 RepID=A0A845S954_9PROT|nr:2-oxoglutarate dehydrogenase complex dihydrolipoyllysine-residue succinyltransferase [Candidatus Fonsibacter lacus]NBP60112.1 2-oxoglutarate dehydrogenase complex dihydrolipoyllysine-residue succinyltransferase [Pseudomonadota bacterium]NBO62848.1 2-oxoglutarate dehydrogenase complex dihydrolipoyllysine-residue succinyltransferase [Candidatus Fonsibacter lacus]NBY89708.1 2-oxoglutarate dehydrogenase complex dihydrolipoyllysine-residue succinyltransferase [Candidatus Fonsibacter lacus]NCU5289
MAKDLIVPALGESVTEATVSKWLKQVGESVKADEPVVELETDKVSVSVPSPESGILSEIKIQAGNTVNVGAVLGTVGAGTASVTKKESVKAPEPVKPKPVEAPVKKIVEAPVSKKEILSPAVKRIVEEKRIDISTISGSGRDGRILKGDLLESMGLPSAPSAARASRGDEERVKMTRLRATIAKRLKEAQNNAAMLTTFNEIDMSRIIEMRAEYKDGFQKRYGVKLGFMSFFVRSCVEALKAFPIINAEIQQDEIVYKNYYNIGVAVGTEKGLVVPVVRDADELSFADIEKQIIALGEKAKTGQLSIEELQGGTFTITNGGIYGSMLSTPILNPPQSGVLGMHNIVQRAVVVEGKVEVRPIMYLALSYDHRIIDGKDAVSFLVRVKEYLEDPRRLFLNL